MSNLVDGEKPTIHLIDSEADALSDLAMAAEARSPEVTAKLLEEIVRASIYERDELPTHVVTMGSYVEFVDEGSGADRTVQLVWPGEANMEENRLSVMTLVGAGLIGMQEDTAIEWPDRAGHVRRLRIAKVKQPIRDRGVA
jgi:regulator of nucleoside diphosphate kinase